MNELRRKPIPRFGSKRRNQSTGLLLAALLALSCLPQATAGEPFRLPSVIPDDVFIVAAGVHRPERDFLCDYWNDVWMEFEKSGVMGDVMELIATAMDDEDRAEFDRLKTRFIELVEAVDWEQMGLGEVAFAERMPRFIVNGDDLKGGMPDMVVLFRGDPIVTAKNFDRLSAILAAILDEAGKASGRELALTNSAEAGLRLSVFDPCTIHDDAPPMAISIGHYKDVLFLAMGDAIRDDVVNLLLGKGDKQAIATTDRYKDAFAQLRAPEDGVLFVDIRTLTADLNVMAEQMFSVMRIASEDRVENRDSNPEAEALNGQGFAAYEAGDSEKALALFEEAHEIAPANPVVIYNLACMNALLGNKDKALDWLAKSVEAGFHSPNKIAEDSDLDALRDDPRYAAAFENAKKHAGGGDKDEIAIARGLAKRCLDTLGIMDYAAVVEYTDGYSTYTDEITALAGDAESNAFYPVLSGREPMTDFAKYLPKETSAFSVDNGFSLDALYTFIENTFAETGDHGRDAWKQWGEVQKEMGFDIHKDVLDWLDTASVCASFQVDGRDAWVFMLKTGNEQTAGEKIGYALEKLPEMMTELIAEQPMLGMLAIRTEPTENEDLAGFHDVSLMMMPKPAVCGVRDGWIMLASSEDAALLCLSTAAGDHPNVRQNARVMAEALVPNGPVTTISLTDHRGTAEEISGVLAGMSMAGGMASAMIPEPEAQKIIGRVFGIVAKLAPVAAKIDFYKSSANYCQFDGKKYHTRSVTHYLQPDERPSAKKAAPAAAKR
jgi:tetratricopeptide (TPR) repeat protein